MVLIVIGITLVGWFIIETQFVVNMLRYIQIQDFGSNLHWY